MNSRMNAKYAASLASSSVSATTSTRTPASWPVTAWLGSSAPRTASSPKIRVATRSRPSRTASANRGAAATAASARVGPDAGLGEQRGFADAEQRDGPEPLAAGALDEHGVGRARPSGRPRSGRPVGLGVGRVGEVEEAARVLLLRRVGALVEGVRHQRADGRPGVARDGDRTSKPGLVEAGPDAPARVARAPARGRRTPAACRRSAATAVGIPRSIGSAMNRPMSSARPVMTPSTPRSSAAITGSGPIRATIRSASVDVVGGESGRQRRDRARPGRPAGHPRWLASSRSRSTSDRTTPTSSDQPLRSAERVERLQAGVEMRVGPGDPEREDERHPVLDGGPDVGLDVGRLVGRDLLAGAEPVRAPVAAGALRHDDVDAPLERPRDVGLDPGTGAMWLTKARIRTGSTLMLFLLTERR